MRGPYAQFSTEEVKLIQSWAEAAQQRPDGELNKEMIEEIRAKCQAAANWDPRLRTPSPQLTPRELSYAQMYGM